jgi:hypothetical protein
MRGVSYNKAQAQMTKLCQNFGVSLKHCSGDLFGIFMIFNVKFKGVNH